MKLIGIKLHSCDSYIRKTLKENTWYPFGQYQEPTKDNGWTWQSEYQQKNDTLCTKMYQVMAEDKNESLNISVNCIVGKNGSGKSTLLDILYRIINNFSYCLIDKAWSGNTLDKNPQRGHSLVLANGIDATIFFESDDVTGYIHNCFENVYYSYYSNNKDARFENLKIEKNLSKTKIEQITRHFFYSICTNYSIHSFNEEDYTPPKLWIQYENSNIDGKWIKGLFHKNDGYVVPITMVPFRDENGNINIVKENSLAKQRLATLALLFASQKKDFLGIYTPKRIIYRFKQDAYSDYNERFADLCHANFLNLKLIGHLRDSIKRCWRRKIYNHYGDKYSSLGDEVKKALLMYLTYKTLKTCILYRKYGETLGVRPSKNMKNKDNGDYLKYRKHDETLGVRPSPNMKTKDYDYYLKYRKYCEMLGVIPFTNMKNENNAYYLNYSDKSINEVVEDILSRDTKIHVNLKIQQLLYWLKKLTYKTPNVVDIQNLPGDGKNDSAIGWEKEPIEKFYRKTEEGKTVPFKTYDQAFLSMPPALFEWDITFLKKGCKDEESLSQMSSGERQLMHSISYIIYHIKNIESITDDNYRLRYHNISLVFDEAELYYHPDYQRKFVSNLIKMLSWCHINHNIIRGVNILIVTHSPFVLSDVPLANTLYLKDGNVVSKEKETFCGNVHELLGGNFFMDYSIGDVARENVEEIIRIYNQRHEKKLHTSNKILFKENIHRYRYVASIVADQYLNIKINEMINDLEAMYDEEMSIDEQIQEAQRKLQLLEEKKKR